MSQAFRGQYEHSLDAKDRLTVPARLRGPLSDGVVLVAGLDPCVEVFSPQGYDDWSARFLADLNRLGRKGRMMYRRFNGRPRTSRSTPPAACASPST